MSEEETMDNEICATCGKLKKEHIDDGCGGYLSSAFSPSGNVSVPASFIDKARALCAGADEYDVSLCTACKRLNPQHKECTSCNERDSLMTALTAVREALAKIDKGE